MSDIWERIDSFIKYKNLSDNAFEKQAALSTSYIRKAISNKSSIGHKVIEKIILGFPDLNPNWLRTGEGSMMKSDEVKWTGETRIEKPDSHQGNVNPTELSNYKHLYEQALIKVESLERELKTKDELIENLKERIEEMKEALKEAREALKRP